jgi:hypothetical protein
VLEGGRHVLRARGLGQVDLDVLQRRGQGVLRVGQRLQRVLPDDDFAGGQPVALGQVPGPV